MSDPLATYLHDHLAGSNFAIELLKNLHDQHAGEPLGQFAAVIRIEIEEERQVLQRIIDQVGNQPPALKEAAAWVLEKLSRFKLTHAGSGELGTFEALETLGLGILGRAALWRALSVIAPTDARVHGPDFDTLAAGALAQHARVEERRLQVASTALRSARD
jgi:hypothetical protein